MSVPGQNSWHVLRMERAHGFAVRRYPCSWLRRSSPLICCCRTAAAALAPVYTSTVTGVQFRLNTAKLNFSAAEAECARNGGHLASFTSIDEQSDVEQFYIKQGFLFPEYNQHYWLGLNASAATGPYKWISPDVPASQINAYKNWPSGQPAAGSNTCGAGSFGMMSGAAWGWVNTQCISALVSICRLNRESLLVSGGVACLSAYLPPPCPTCLSASSIHVCKASPISGNQGGADTVPLPCSAAPNVFTYQSPINNATYILNTNKMSQPQAQAYCVDQGGHLVAYGSEAEQVRQQELQFRPFSGRRSSGC